MTDIAPLSKGAAYQSPEAKVSVPLEAHLPSGGQASTVQPVPMPVVAAAPEAEHMASDVEKRLHVAQMRSDITGTGALVDVIV